MSWFSDPLFGEKKRLDPNKINSFMSDYDRMVGEQEDMALEMMDPNSMYSQRAKQSIRSNVMDTAGAQNQSLLGYAAASGMNPAQAAMQARGAMHTARGQAGQQFDSSFQNQMSQGQGLYGQAMAAEQRIGERGANMYMQQINEANARRQQNMQLAMQGVGTAMSFAAPFIPQPGGP